MSEKNQKKKSGRGGLGALILVVVVCIAAVMAWAFLPEAPGPAPVQTTEAPPRTTSAAPALEPGVQIDFADQIPINLGYGLEITDAGSYTGLYMEDGSDEIVSGVMMIVVRNGGEDDFQLGQITAVCGGEEYHFTLTNLPAGTQVVLLDQDRKTATGDGLESAILDNPVVFPEPMELHEDVIRLQGMDGMMNVENISDSNITADIYVYYKYASQDAYYGGITFRVRVEGGLKAGELRQIPASHYSPDGCAIVQVTIHG